jgi:RNA polymerase sigma-70 factor (ECF subfamily)
VAWFYRVLRNAVIDHYRRNGAATRGLENFAREVETREAATPDVHEAVCRCVNELASRHLGEQRRRARLSRP